MYVIHCPLYNNVISSSYKSTAVAVQLLPSVAELTCENEIQVISDFGFVTTAPLACLIGGGLRDLLTPCVRISYTPGVQVIVCVVVVPSHTFHRAYASHRHSNPSSMQDVCPMNLV